MYDDVELHAAKEGMYAGFVDDSLLFRSAIRCNGQKQEFFALTISLLQQQMPAQ
jgi:hypothetical protein